MSDTTIDPKDFIAELDRIDAELSQPLKEGLRNLRQDVWEEEIAIEETSGGVRTIIKQGAKAIDTLASILQ